MNQTNMKPEQSDPIVHAQFNRYASSQFTFQRSKENVSPLRQGFVDMARGINPTHYLTFNFYDKYSMESAKEKLDKWYVHVHHRLFRTHPSEMKDAAMPMIGFPEYTKRDHIHYHTFATINPEREHWFMKFAARKWKTFVRTGELHIKGVDGTEVGLEAAAVYSTKSSSFGEWYIPTQYKGSAFAESSHAGQTKH